MSACLKSGGDDQIKSCFFGHPCFGNRGHRCNCHDIAPFAGCDNRGCRETEDEADDRRRGVDQRVDLLRIGVVKMRWKLRLLDTEFAEVRSVKRECAVKVRLD